VSPTVLSKLELGAGLRAIPPSLDRLCEEAGRPSIGCRFGSRNRPAGLYPKFCSAALIDHPAAEGLVGHQQQPPMSPCFLSNWICRPHRTLAVEVRLVGIKKDQQQQGTNSRATMISSKETHAKDMPATNSKGAKGSPLLALTCGGNASEAFPSEQGMQEKSPIRSGRCI